MGIDRRGTYTMTLSGSAEMGTAYAVPFRQRIHSFPELETEVRALAAAEGFEDVERWPGWGVVSLNTRDAIAAPLVSDIVNHWAKSFREHVGASRVQEVHGPDEEPQVDAQGYLTIEWPRKRDGGDPLDFDLLLATANVPSLRGNRYASPPEIAKSLGRVFKVVDSQNARLLQ